VFDFFFFFFQYEIRLYTVVFQGQIHKLQKEKMYYVGGDMDFGAEVKSSIDSIADR
jgi:hypothetical protein